MVETKGADLGERIDAETVAFIEQVRELNRPPTGIDDPDPDGSARLVAWRESLNEEFPPWYIPGPDYETEAQALARIRRTGRLWYQPEGRGGSLAPILEVEGLADSVTQLTLFASASFDASGLALLPNLRRLATNVRVPDAVELPALVEYEGPFVPSVLRAPHLKRLANGEATFSGTELEISSPVEHIELTRSRSLARFPTLSRPDRLRTFSLYRSKGFDLGGIEACTGLESLELASVRSVGCADRLAALRSMVLLTFENVREIDPIEALRLASPFRAKVIATHPFPRELRAELAASSSRWTFPPSEAFYRGSAASK